jgi:drug/metabolite transporter (DMT)-like permease
LCGVQTQQLHFDLGAVWLALLSGGLASGAGYAVWYAALKNLPAIRAAIVQLSVPVVAAAYGVLFMGEPLSSRLVVASGLVLSGVAVALRGR